MARKRKKKKRVSKIKVSKNAVSKQTTSSSVSNQKSNVTNTSETNNDEVVLKQTNTDNVKTIHPDSSVVSGVLPVMSGSITIKEELPEENNLEKKSNHFSGVISVEDSELQFGLTSGEITIESQKPLALNFGEKKPSSIMVEDSEVILDLKSVDNKNDFNDSRKTTLNLKKSAISKESTQNKENYPVESLENMPTEPLDTSESIKTNEQQKENTKTSSKKRKRKRKTTLPQSTPIVQVKPKSSTSKTDNSSKHNTLKEKIQSVPTPFVLLDKSKKNTKNNIKVWEKSNTNSEELPLPPPPDDMPSSSPKEQELHQSSNDSSRIVSSKELITVKSQDKSNTTPKPQNNSTQPQKKIEKITQNVATPVDTANLIKKNQVPSQTSQSLNTSTKTKSISPDNITARKEEVPDKVAFSDLEKEFFEADLTPENDYADLEQIFSQMENEKSKKGILNSIKGMFIANSDIQKQKNKTKRKSSKPISSRSRRKQSSKKSNKKK